MRLSNSIDIRIILQLLIFNECGGTCLLLFLKKFQKGKNSKIRKSEHGTQIQFKFRSKMIFLSKRSYFWKHGLGLGGGSKLKAQGMDSYPVNKCNYVYCVDNQNNMNMKMKVAREIDVLINILYSFATFRIFSLRNEKNYFLIVQ